MIARLFTVAWIVGLVFAGMQSSSMSLEMAWADITPAETSCGACNDAEQPAGIVLCQTTCLAAPAVLAEKMHHRPAEEIFARISSTEKTVAGLHPNPEPAPPKHSTRV